MLQERREGARQRQAVIAANAELQERELIKRASLASALRRRVATTRRNRPGCKSDRRGGIAVFKVAFERWVEESNQLDLPQLIRESFNELKAVTAGE